MTVPTIGNLAPALADLSGIAREARELHRRANDVLKDIRPALIGLRVRRYGREWQICQVDIRGNASLTCCGVTVSKRGKVGTRAFDLGRLEDCEFLA